MEIMKHDFGGYIPHIAFIYLLIPLAARKCELLLTSVQQLSVVPSLFITFFISHTCLPLRLLPPLPSRDLQSTPSTHTHFNRQSKVQAHATNGSDQRAAGIHGLMGQKPTTPRTQTGQVVPNPPTLPAFLWSASLTSLLIITVVIGIWGLFLSKFCGWPWSTGSRALEEDRHAVKSRAKRSS